MTRAHSLRNLTRDRNEDCISVTMRVANPLLRVLSMVIYMATCTDLESLWGQVNYF